MGEDVYPDFEDNGGPSEFLFIGYKFEDNDFIDHIVVYENLFGTESARKYRLGFARRYFPGSQSCRMATQFGSVKK